MAKHGYVQYQRGGKGAMSKIGDKTDIYQKRGWSMRINYTKYVR